MFQALADESRRSILERLSAGPAAVSELAKPLAMTLSAVMQHLKVLITSGLVITEKAGRVRTCRLDARAMRTAEDWLAERRAALEHRLDRLGEFLAANPEPKE